MTNMLSAVNRYALSRDVAVNKILEDAVLFSAMLQFVAREEEHPASVPKHLTALSHWFDPSKNGGVVREGDFSRDPQLLNRAELLVAALFQGSEPGDEIPWHIIKRSYEILGKSRSSPIVIARTEVTSDLLLLPANRIAESA